MRGLIPRRIATATKTTLFPPDGTGTLDHKNVVFISHATPESNEFATWLAARLTAVGYSVWLELRELEVGDRFWPEIESTIRTRSIKFVTVVTKSATNKYGFRRELSLADAIERQMPGFILPVRADDISHLDLPAEIHDKQVLDFTDGWHRGLAALIKRLEKDGVARTADTQTSVSNLALVQLDEQQKPLSKSEMIVSNWLAADAVPAGIRLHQFTGDPIGDRTFKNEWPSRVVGNVLITFARLTDFTAFKYYTGRCESSEMLVDSFLAQKCPQFPTLSVADRRSIFADLLRQGWERAMTLRGLHAYELASGRLVWYLPWKLSAGKQLPLVDAEGKSGRRALNGESAKLSCRWHFAVAANVLLRPELRVSLNYTVVFTKDGLEPLEDKAKAHRFRRSFCKNWWQDRWRDMLYAYVAYIKGKAHALTISVAPDRELKFCPQLTTFVASVAALEPVRTEQLPDELVDSLAGDESDFENEPSLEENESLENDGISEETPR